VHLFIFTIPSFAHPFYTNYAVFTSILISLVTMGDSTTVTAQNFKP